MYEVTLYTVEEHKVLSHGCFVEMHHFNPARPPIRADNNALLEVNVIRTQLPIHRIAHFENDMYVAIDPVLERYLRIPYASELADMTNAKDLAMRALKQAEARWASLFALPWYRRVWAVISKKEV